VVQVRVEDYLFRLRKASVREAAAESRAFSGMSNAAKK
jgi:hypothetical protein